MLLIMEEALSQEKPVKKKPFNKVILQLIAATAMLADHLTWILFPGYSLHPAAIVLHIFGRLAFPIFAFFIAEGYHYTHDKKKYLIRLLILSLISHVPYMMASIVFQQYGWMSLIPFATGEGINRFLNQASVLLSYAVGLLMLMVKDSTKLKQWTKVVIILLLCVISFPCDWSCIGSLVVLSIGSNRGHPLKQIIWSYFWIIVYGSVYFFALNKVYALIQLGTILVVPLLYLYNGQKSKNQVVNKVMRYFFYIFYPLHLLILGLINLL